MAPSAATNPARRAVAGLVLALTLLLAGPVAAQEVPTTTSGVLVQGDPTATTQPAAPAGTGGAGTTTTSTTEAPEEDGGLLGLDLDANEKVWIIVGGLVLVAILLSVLTVVYWRHTRPDRTGVETRAERRERQRQEKADAKAAKAQAGAAGTAVVGDELPEVEHGVDAQQGTAGPVDVDELLAAPDPSRSVFGEPDDTPS